MAVMRSYLLKRLGHAVIVVWGAYTLSFVLLYLLPSDPFSLMISRNATTISITPAQVAAQRHALGFDRPLWQQYARQLGALVRGEFGTSFTNGEPVRDLMWNALPSTATLAVSALVLGGLIGASVGGLAVYVPSRRIREMIMAIPPIGICIPTYALGLLLIDVFAFRWSLLPSTGDSGLRTLILPSVTLALPISATVAQLFEKCLTEELRKPYIEVAFAKGLSRARVQIGHALRNAAGPVLTAAGLIVANLIGGAVLVETVFARRGLGQLLVTAIGNEDIDVVQGIVVLSAVVFVLVNLAVDLLYPVLDRRISLHSVGPR